MDKDICRGRILLRHTSYNYTYYSTKFYFMSSEQKYLQFIGGIKLREALSHFQKETMTDELTCKFTYWGRRNGTLPFYNTQVAKVFFQAAEKCPTFKGPENRAQFKLEIMEVFRAAKQRQYFKNLDKENRPRRASSSGHDPDDSDDPDDVDDAGAEIIYESDESVIEETINEMVA